MKKLFFFAIFNSTFLILNSFCFAQNRTIDSLLTLLKTEKSDTTRVNYLITLCNEYRKIGSYDYGLKYGNEALQVATDKSERFSKPVRLAMLKSEATSYNTIGNIYNSQGNYSMALKNYFASLQTNEELKNRKDIAGSYLNIGIIYYYLNNYSEALKNYFAALNIRKEIDDKSGIAIAYNNIGTVYDDPENYPDALKNYFSALKIYGELGDKQGVAASYNNIGRIYNSQNNYSDALKMYSASLKMNKDLEDKSGIAFSYINIGNIYWNQVNYPNDQSEEKSSKVNKALEKTILLTLALKNYDAALKIREELADKQGIVESFIGIANVQMDLNHLKEARDYLNKALQLSKEIASKEWLKESYSRFMDLDSMQGNWKDAYQHQKLFVLYKDSIANEDALQKSMKIAMNFDFEKNEAVAKAELEGKAAVAENKKQNIIFGMVVIALLILILFTGYIFRSKRILKKN